MNRVLATTCTALAFVVGCAAIDYSARATNVLLRRDAASYFYSDHLRGSNYIEFKPDGTYTEIGREHFGVEPFDGGTWTQDTNAVLWLVSTSRYDCIVSPPIEIYVGNFGNTNCLPDLRAALIACLRTNCLFAFRLTQDDGMPIFWRGKDGHGLQVDHTEAESWEDNVASRTDIEHLISAIDRFVKNPPLRTRKAIAKTYKGRVFLLWLPRNAKWSWDLADICSAIDKAGLGQAVFYHGFLIQQEQFERETHTAYPFMFHPEMNRAAGGE
jgi:hypothetical protein